MKHPTEVQRWCDAASVARKLRLCCVPITRYLPASRCVPRLKRPHLTRKVRHDVTVRGSSQRRPAHALGRAQYPALLADINRAHVAFSVHDGDLKAGGDGPCADSLYYTALNYFNSLEQPVIFTTGDNDWTDCWGRYGPSTLPYSDPIERLDFERMLFFSTDRSLGRHTLKLTRQTAEGYPENQRWRRGPVVYLAVNVQGSNDNYPYPDTDAEGGPTVPVRSAAEIQRERNEELARKAADLRWLEEGFDYAKQVHAAGVMIIWQADPNSRHSAPGTRIGSARRSTHTIPTCSCSSRASSWRIPSSRSAGRGLRFREPDALLPRTVPAGRYGFFAKS